MDKDTKNLFKENKLLRDRTYSLNIKIKALEKRELAYENKMEELVKKRVKVALANSKPIVKEIIKKEKHNSDIYKQLENALKQIDAQSKTISELSKALKALDNINEKFLSLLEKSEEQSGLIKELIEGNKTKDELNAKLLLEIDRLKNQINKDSSNSSKPGSTDTKPPKSGANLYNGRKKSGKKQGGQLGHKGHNLSKSKVEELINNNEIIVKEFIHHINGDSNQDPLVKYKLGIECIPYVEKHIFKYDEKTETELPKEFYTDVTYTPTLKGICIHLGSYNVVAIDRLSDFLSVMTNNIINVSNGSICNWFKEFGELCEPEIKKLEDHLLNQNVMHTDLTESKENNSKIYFRNYSNSDTAVYKYNKKKGHDPIIEDNILSRFTGTIVGDHDTALYSYGNNNCECNTHGGRYLEEITQNVEYITWTKELHDFLYELNKIRKEAKANKKTEFSQKEIDKYFREYDDLLAKGKIENEEIKSKFYRDKAKRLYKRLIKYKENHLLFIKDFEVPFTNNLSEQDLRIIKTKTKISKFRSEIGARSYANALSVIKTSIKRNINPFDAIKKIFEKEPLFG